MSKLTWGKMLAKFPLLRCGIYLKAGSDSCLILLLSGQPNMANSPMGATSGKPLKHPYYCQPTGLPSCRPKPGTSPLLHFSTLLETTFFLKGSVQCWVLHWILATVTEQSFSLYGAFNVPKHFTIFILFIFTMTF